MSVSSGPAAGATRVFITGLSLRGGDDYRCRFGGLIVPTVYENDGSLSDGSRATRQTTIVPQFSPTAAIVTAAYSAGVTDEQSISYPWAPDRASRISCVAPSTAVVGSVILQVSLNAQQYLGELTYTYHGGVVVLGLSPNSGPELGSTHVVVSGKELELGSHYVCRFNATVVPARLVPSTLTQYVTFTERHVGLAVTAAHRAQGTYVHRTLGTRAHDCDAYDSDDVGELDRVSAAVAACTPQRARTLD